MSSEIVPFKRGMERGATSKEIDTFVMSSLADFIKYSGRRPAGAIVLWIDDGGEQIASWCNASPSDIALASVHLAREALGG